MKQALVIEPVLGNNYGSLTPTVEGIVRELTNSFYTRKISIEAPYLLDAILDVGRSPENVIFYGWFGFDLTINGLNAGTPKQVASFLKAKQIAIVDDPIFAPWIFERVKRASSKVKFLCTSPLLYSQVREIREAETEISRVEIPAPIPIIPLESTPSFDDRKYDILIPCSATELDIEHLVTRGQRDLGLGDLATQYIDIVKLNVSHTTYSRFDSYEFSRKFFFSTIPGLREKVRHPIEYPQILNFVWEVDCWIRHSFRIEVIRSICRTRGLRIRLLSDSGLKLDANADLEVTAPVRGEDYYNLLLDSRYVVDIAVTGATAMHIRAKSAFAAGAAVISNNVTLSSILDLDEMFRIDVNKLRSQPDWLQRRIQGYSYIKQISYAPIIEEVLA